MMATGLLALAAASTTTASPPPTAPSILSHYWLESRLVVCRQYEDAACLSAYASLVQKVADGSSAAIVARLGRFDPNLAWDECTSHGSHAQCFLDVVLTVWTLTQLPGPLFHPPFGGAPCDYSDYNSDTCLVEAFALPPQTAFLSSSLSECFNDGMERASECSMLGFLSLTDKGRRCMLAQAARHAPLSVCSGYDGSRQQQECFEWALDRVAVGEDGELRVDECYLDIVAEWMQEEKLALSRNDVPLTSELRRCLSENPSESKPPHQADPFENGVAFLLWEEASTRQCVLTAVEQAMGGLESAVERCVEKEAASLADSSPTSLLLQRQETPPPQSLVDCAEAALREWEWFGESGRASPLSRLVQHCPIDRSRDDSEEGWGLLVLRSTRLDAVLSWAKTGLLPTHICPPPPGQGTPFHSLYAAAADAAVSSRMSAFALLQDASDALLRLQDDVLRLLSIYDA